MIPGNTAFSHQQSAFGYQLEYGRSIFGVGVAIGIGVGCFSPGKPDTDSDPDPESSELIAALC
jgi:hypothetical protein